MATHMTSRPRAAQDVALRFIEVAYGPDDWLALVAKSHTSGAVLQRVRPHSWFLTARVQSWLRALNAQRWSHYISVNALSPGQRSRRRAAVTQVRHVLLDADRNGTTVLQTIARRPDLPPPSYVVHSSRDRVHILWRVTGFACDQVEPLQRCLARELLTDHAATACSQTTRLPGFMNHKYTPPPVVTVDYLNPRATYERGDFPSPLDGTTPPADRHLGRVPDVIPGEALGRARRYLAVIEPAVAGQHGDQHTFRVCCRLVRGFALSDADALDALCEWNARCQPPWSLRDLQAKLRHARRYGREPVGGRLGGVTS